MKKESWKREERSVRDFFFSLLKYDNKGPLELWLSSGYILFFRTSTREIRLRQH